MSQSTPRIHTLANGLRVVADPMDGLQTCAISLVVRGGARWEDAARNGWSHLLEHMVFKGAGGRSARDIVEGIEAQGGQINAATGYERTSFQVRCLQDGLPLAVEVLADLVRRPTLAEADLQAEKNVIAQEIAEAADQPDDRVFDLAQGLAFPGQSLGRPILGTVENLAAADPAKLRAFHQALYAPERMVVCAAGAVDEDVLLRLSEAAFGDAPGASGTPLAPSPALFTAGGAAETRRLEQAHVVMLLPGVGASDPDYFALRLFAEALGGGMSSRLFQRVREDLGLAYAIDAYAESYEDAGVLGIYCGSSAADAARAAEASAQALAELADAPTAAELARSKAQLKAHLFMARESPLARAEQAAARLHLFDRLLTPEELEGGIDAVTLADLQRVGSRMLADERRVAAVLGPRRAAGALQTFSPTLKAA